jgi:predicted transcriptional regulator
MPRGDWGEDLAEVLRQRGRFLDELVHERLDKPALEERLGLSRSTVDRALRELESRSLVRRADGEFTVTLTGRLAQGANEAFRSQMQDIAGASELLAYLPADCDLPVEVLRGAEVQLAELPATLEPIERIDHLFTEADRAYTAVGMLTNPSTPKMAAKAVLDGDLRYEAVYRSDLARYLRERRSEERRQMVSTGRYEVYEVDDLPVSFARFDCGEESTVVVHAFDDDGNLQGIIENDSAAAVEWTERTFDRYREQGRRITDEFDREADGNQAGSA